MTEAAQVPEFGCPFQGGLQMDRPRIAGQHPDPTTARAFQARCAGPTCAVYIDERSNPFAYQPI